MELIRQHCASPYRNRLRGVSVPRRCRARRMVLEGSAWFGGADRTTHQLFNFCLKIKKDVSGERLDLALTLVFDVLTMHTCLRRCEVIPGC